MNKILYYKTASTLFAIVSILHLIRAIQGWEARIDGVMVPVWISWVFFLLTAYLSIRGFQFIRQTGVK